MPYWRNGPYGYGYYSTPGSSGWNWSEGNTEEFGNIKDYPDEPFDDGSGKNDDVTVLAPYVVTDSKISTPKSAPNNDPNSRGCTPVGTPHIIAGNTGTAVQVGFTSTAHGAAVHTMVILTDRATGQQFMAEATPSGESVSGGLNRLVPGNAVLVAQPLTPFSSSDFTIVGQQDVGVINQPISTVATTVQTYNNTINLASISYSGSTLGGYNSNSYGSGLILNLGFNLPPLPSGLDGLGPVGWTKPIPDPEPNNSRICPD